MCTSTYLAKMTRPHNNSNILCLGGKVTGVFEALDILDTWLETPYEGGRHDISLGLIAEAERALCTSSLWRPIDPMNASDERTSALPCSDSTQTSTESRYAGWERAHVRS